MSVLYEIRNMLRMFSVVIIATLAATGAYAQDTVGDYITYLQKYSPTLKVHSAVIIVLDADGQPMEPDLWPNTVRADTQAFLIQTAACGVLAQHPVLLEQQAGAFWHRWCRDPKYPYARRDTYYYASGRLVFQAPASLQRNCITQLSLIPTPVQVICE